jgi:hypothetical protein
MKPGLSGINAFCGAQPPTQHHPRALRGLGRLHIEPTRYPIPHFEAVDGPPDAAQHRNAGNRLNCQRRWTVGGRPVGVRNDRHRRDPTRASR